MGGGGHHRSFINMRILINENKALVLFCMSEKRQGLIIYGFLM